MAAAENAGCGPEDLDCVQASIGGLGEATVEAVAVWDGHVRGLERGLAGWCCMRGSRCLRLGVHNKTPAPLHHPAHIPTHPPPTCLHTQGHGTHVGGIACGTTYGVAKRATLHAVQTM